MRIDVHAHFSPTQYFDRMAELGAFEELPVFTIMRALFRPETRKPGTPPPNRDDVPRRLADMDAGGVDVQIVSLGAAQPYFADPSKAVAGARWANDLARGLMDDHPGRFSAFGAIPLPHVGEAVAEVGRCLDDLGFAGVGIGCSAAGIPIDDARFEPLWAELDARRAVVQLHPGAGIHGIVGAAEYHLAPDFVSPAEIAVAAARLVVTGVTTRYPDVEILLATTGGSLPFFARRFDRGLRQDDAAAYDALGGFLPHLRRFHYDTSVLEEPLVLREGAQLFGADRIMLGSDYARPAVTSAAAVAYVETAPFLSAEDKQRILDGNARQLFAGRLMS